MYWIDKQHLLLIIILCYLIGTVVGIYISKITYLGVMVWLIGLFVLGFVGIFIAGKDWNRQ